MTFSFYGLKQYFKGIFESLLIRRFCICLNCPFLKCPSSEKCHSKITICDNGRIFVEKHYGILWEHWDASNIFLQIQFLLEFHAGYNQSIRITSCLTQYNRNNNRTRTRQEDKCKSTCSKRRVANQNLAIQQHQPWFNHHHLNNFKFQYENKSCSFEIKIKMDFYKMKENVMLLNK